MSISKKHRILIVDDSDVNLDLLSNLLMSPDYEIATVNSGIKAIKKAQANEFDLILLDIIMPEMDGFEVCKKLKSIKVTKDIPIIFITAKTDSSSLLEGFDAGAVDYVFKPFNPPELMARVRTHLELKNSREQLIEAKKIADRNSQFKSEFLAHMSHEIRTPINGIIGILDLLNDTNLDDKQKEYTDIASRSAETLLSLINDILDFSKIEAGQVSLEAIDFDYRKLMKSTIENFKQRFLAKNLDYKLNIDDNIPEVLKGDITRFTQVLNNLISNAIKFTDKGSVEVNSLFTEERKGKQILKVSVKDTGIGISKKGLSKLFKSFSQVDSSTTRRYGGTGLGLAISKRLIELMGGNINVNSQENVGTEFYFDIAFTKGDINNINDKPIEKVEIKSSNKLKILMAEDNPLNQKVALFLLDKLRHEVDVVENGRDAVAKFKEENYDLILMDINMPELDGIDATRLIRKYERERKEKKPVKIAAVTANAFADDRDRCLRNGMDFYISKPFKANELNEILKQV